MAKKTKKTKTPSTPRPVVRAAYRGMHAWRCVSEPLERAFALEWQSINEMAGGACGRDAHSHLAYLLSEDSGRPEPLSDRDKRIAATLIQWLGSPCGQAFVNLAQGRGSP